MKELFDFIQSSYDDVPSSENTTQEKNVAVDTTTTVAPTPVVTQQTTEEFIRIRPAANQKKTSSTTETKDAGLPLYEVNNQLLLDLGNESINQDVQQATRLFNAVKQNPVVNGKPIEIGTLSEVMKDPNSRKAIMSQVAKLYDDPSLDPQTKWDAMMNDWYATGINSSIPLIQKKIHEMMYQSAMAVDATLKSRNINPKGTDLKVEKKPGFFGNDDTKYDVKATEMFNENGDFLTQDQFRMLYLQRKVDAYNAFITKQKEGFGNSSSVTTAYNRAPYTDENGVRHVMNYNQMNQARYKDAEEDLAELGRRMKMAEEYRKAGLESELDPQNRLDALKKNGLPSNWRKQMGKVSNVESYANTMGGVVEFDQLPKITDKNYKQVIAQMQSNLHKLGFDEYANDASIKRANDVYNTNKDQIIKQYNKSNNASVYKIKAELEGMFKNNKGGGIQSPGAEMDFNFASPWVDAKKKKSGGFKKNIREFTTILAYGLQDDGSALYKYGAVKDDGTGKYLVPDKDDNVKQDIRAIVTGITDDIKLAVPDLVKGKKGSIMLPQGTVVFTRKCFDESGKEYHAFQVKLNSNYFNQHKWKGTQDNPGIAAQHPELVTDGFTIFVPADVSRKSSTVALESEKASQVSNTEALLALSKDNTPVTIPFKGAGEITLSQNKENGSVTVGGYHVAYNTKGSYDTVRIQPQYFKEDQFTDIDRSIDDQINILKGKFFMNEYIKTELLKLKGVNDPNKLTQTGQ